MLVITALTRRFPPAAWWFAIVLFWGAVHPTLMPRNPTVQGIVNAAAIGLGLAVGTLVASIAAEVARRTHRRLPTPLGDLSRPVTLGAATVVGVVGSVLWVVWQREQASLLNAEPLTAGAVIPMLVVTALVTVVLIVIGRVLAGGVRRLNRMIARHVPLWIAVSITVVVVTVAGVVITRDVVLSRIMDAVNTAYGTVDTETEPGVEPPVSTLRSGGPESLVAWDDLGEQGRTFVASGPTRTELEAFAGPDTAVADPVRVYVGLRAADTPQEQAALAVAELERTGGFSRDVLVVVTVTGTGWINPLAAAGVEYLWDGNTALVATQYSYLPSWISFIVDLDTAAAAARSLLDAVVDRWSELPPDRRPRLVVFGESLGSFGSESGFAPDGQRPTPADVTATVDAALWVGPTFNNPIWNQVLDSRIPNAPVWDPVQPDRSPVRILGAPDEPPPPPNTDGESRIVYLTHPSDPVTWATFSSLWWRPPWMHRPTGYDVPDTLRWMPGVTFVQNLFDLMAGFSAPPGHGHDYAPNIADGWVATVAPPGWDDTDTLRLRTQLFPGLLPGPTE